MKGWGGGGSVKKNGKREITPKGQSQNDENTALCYFKLNFHFF